MIHKHQFFTVTKNEPPRGLDSITIVCIELGCGATRLVYPDGTVTVAHEGLPDREEEIKLTPKDLEVTCFSCMSQPEKGWTHTPKCKCLCHNSAGQTSAPGVPGVSTTQKGI